MTSHTAQTMSSKEALALQRISIRLGLGLDQICNPSIMQKCAPLPSSSALESDSSRGRAECFSRLLDKYELVRFPYLPPRSDCVFKEREIQSLSSEAQILFDLLINCLLSPPLASMVEFVAPGIISPLLTCCAARQWTQSELNFPFYFILFSRLLNHPLLAPIARAFCNNEENRMRFLDFSKKKAQEFVCLYTRTATEQPSEDTYQSCRSKLEELGCLIAYCLQALSAALEKGCSVNPVFQSTLLIETMRLLSYQIKDNTFLDLGNLWKWLRFLSVCCQSTLFSLSSQESEALCRHHNLSTAADEWAVCQHLADPQSDMPSSQLRSMLPFRLLLDPLHSLPASDDVITLLSSPSNSPLSSYGAPELQIWYNTAVSCLSNVVITSSVQKILQHLVVIHSQAVPCLVMGHSGSGKSFYLQSLHALLVGNQDQIIWLFLDATTDSKSLLGSWQSGETPGEFVWVDGVVVKAMKSGRWIVFENIDKVPQEVQTKLKELANGNELFIAERSLQLKAHPNFRVFGTISLQPSVRSHHCLIEKQPSRSLCKPKLLAEWRSIHLPPLTKTDIVAIARKRHPSLSDVVDLIFAAYEQVQASDAMGSLGSHCRHLGVRDFFKLCLRLSKFPCCQGVVMRAPLLENVKLRIIREFFLCFAFSVPDVLLRIQICEIFGESLGISSIHTRQYILEKPSISRTKSAISVGCVIHQLEGETSTSNDLNERCYGYTDVHSHVLEALLSCFHHNEPLLLAGDTGTGKTSVIQHLATLINQKAVVYNFSEQSETADLVGKIVPEDCASLLQKIKRDFFELLNSSSFLQLSRRLDLIARFEKKLISSDWLGCLAICCKIADGFVALLSQNKANMELSKDSTLLSQWTKFQSACYQYCMGPLFNASTMKSSTTMRFRFEEGILIRALREGLWLILDEINLAPADVLQRIRVLLDPASLAFQKFVLNEHDGEEIIAHPHFRIFACYNPSVVVPIVSRALVEGTTHKCLVKPSSPPGVGKKELPAGIRQCFTEVFVDEVVVEDDLRSILCKYIPHSVSSPLSSVASFFLIARNLSHQHLISNGSGKAPHYSLRTLVRAAKYSYSVSTRTYKPKSPIDAMANGLVAHFATGLSNESFVTILELIEKTLGWKSDMVMPIKLSHRQTIKSKGGGRGVVPTNFAAIEFVRRQRHGGDHHHLLLPLSLCVLMDEDNEKNRNQNLSRLELNQNLSSIGNDNISNANRWAIIEGHVIACGPTVIDVFKAHQNFVVTSTVKRHLNSLARVLSGGRVPILLEGPTSAGKSSLVKYLCQLTGHHFVRINNHEQTDLQEYLGQHITDPQTGQLVFVEGAIAQAARHGHWVVLDELNLAPSEALEALNRLLDDNRELSIPETGTTIKAHPDFMVFATQNPASGAYGGRKLLSKAFRNRFIEIFIDEIPVNELVIILQSQCHLPPSFTTSMISVYEDLKSRRLKSSVFESSRSFMTIRDLLRWGNRRPASREALALEGYCIIAERLRGDPEKEDIKQLLESKCLQSDKQKLTINFMEDPIVKEIQTKLKTSRMASKLCLTSSMSRLVALVARCIKYNEPVLLVGETGAGKTTLCQILSILEGRELRIVNCHQTTETADLLGSIRPVKDRSKLFLEAEEVYETLNTLLTHIEKEATPAHQLLKQVLLRTTDPTVNDLLSLLITNKMTQAVEEEGRTTMEDVPSHLGGVLSLADLDTLQQKVDTLKKMCSSAFQSLTDLHAEATSLDKVIDVNQETVDASSCQRAPKQRKLDIIKSSGHQTPPEASPRCLNSETPTTTTSSISVEPSVPELSSDKIIVSKALQLATDAFNLSSDFIGKMTCAMKLFEWVDGPLILSMKTGTHFLLDEISLAEDAVLERLNSVLEPERLIVLAEKGGCPTTTATAGSSAIQTTIESVYGRSGFRIFATMNPGGDFGKRELSPALRNRFTEIWVPAVHFGSSDTLTLIAQQLNSEDNFSNDKLLLALARSIQSCACWFNDLVKFQLSVREVLAWVTFLKIYLKRNGNESKSILLGFVHGGCMVLADSVGLGNQIELIKTEIISNQKAYVMVVERLLHEAALNICPALYMETSFVDKHIRPCFDKNGFAWVKDSFKAQVFEPEGMTLKLGPFSLPCRSAFDDINSTTFTFMAPTTATNLGRILRALQLNRSILLEGPPGAGKTAIVQALAHVTGNQLIRINLSEQSDLMDLLGTDLPAAQRSSLWSSKANLDQKNCGSIEIFQWFDGVLLKAMKEGHWVILDELNLASQQVLEGLNALLDHRRQIFLPELDQTIECGPTFRLFAAQNPLSSGGGRKGLPRSFINRFSRILTTQLTPEDFFYVSQNVFKSMKPNLQTQLITVVSAVQALHEKATFAGGSEWEWNLRDLLRFGELVTNKIPASNPQSSASVLLVSRLRTQRDVNNVNTVIANSFGMLMESQNLHIGLPIDIQRILLAVDEAYCMHGISDASKLHAWTLEIQDSLKIKKAEMESTISINDGTSLPLNVITNVNSDSVSIGTCTFQRHYERSTSFKSLGLLTQSDALVRVAHAVHLNWPVLVTGKPLSGKASLIRHLAALVGTQLTEVTLSESMDSTELLGTYEPESGHSYVHWCLSFIEYIRQRLIQYYTRSLDFQNVIERSFEISCSTFSNFDSKKVHEWASEVLRLCHQLDSRVQNLISRRCEAVLRCIRLIQQTQLRSSPENLVKFRWIDGQLLQSVEKGDWLLLRHIHFCSPAVLDRLNSLLEPNGFILLTECGEPQIIKPHPNFRIFFTSEAAAEADSKMSKALRNRCLEIFVGPRTAYSMENMKSLSCEPLASDDKCRRSMHVYHLLMDVFNQIFSQYKHQHGLIGTSSNLLIIESMQVMLNGSQFNREFFDRTRFLQIFTDALKLALQEGATFEGSIFIAVAHSLLALLTWTLSKLYTKVNLSSVLEKLDQRSEIALNHSFSFTDTLRRHVCQLTQLHQEAGVDQQIWFRLGQRIKDQNLEAIGVSGLFLIPQWTATIKFGTAIINNSTTTTTSHCWEWEAFELIYYPTILTIVEEETDNNNNVSLELFKGLFSEVQLMRSQKTEIWRNLQYCLLSVHGDPSAMGIAAESSHHMVTSTTKLRDLKFVCLCMKEASRGLKTCKTDQDICTLRLHSLHQIQSAVQLSLEGERGAWSDLISMIQTIIKCIVIEDNYLASQLDALMHRIERIAPLIHTLRREMSDLMAQTLSEKMVVPSLTEIESRLPCCLNAERRTEEQAAASLSFEKLHILLSITKLLIKLAMIPLAPTSSDHRHPPLETTSSQLLERTHKLHPLTLFTLQHFPTSESTTKENHQEIDALIKAVPHNVQPTSIRMLLDGLIQTNVTNSSSDQLKNLYEVLSLIQTAVTLQHSRCVWCSFKDAVNDVVLTKEFHDLTDILRNHSIPLQVAMNQHFHDERNHKKDDGAMRLHPDLLALRPPFFNQIEFLIEMSLRATFKLGLRAAGNHAMIQNLYSVNHLYDAFEVLAVLRNLHFIKKLNHEKSKDVAMKIHNRVGPQCLEILKAIDNHDHSSSDDHLRRLEIQTEGGGGDGKHLAAFDLYIMIHTARLLILVSYKLQSNVSGNELIRLKSVLFAHFFPILRLASPFCLRAVASSLLSCMSAMSAAQWVIEASNENWLTLIKGVAQQLALSGRDLMTSISSLDGLLDSSTHTRPKVSQLLKSTTEMAKGLQNRSWNTQAGGANDNYDSIVTSDSLENEIRQDVVLLDVDQFIGWRSAAVLSYCHLLKSFTIKETLKVKTSASVLQQLLHGWRDIDVIILESKESLKVPPTTRPQKWAFLIDQLATLFSTLQISSRVEKNDHDIQQLLKLLSEILQLSVKPTGQDTNSVDYEFVFESLDEEIKMLKSFLNVTLDADNLDKKCVEVFAIPILERIKKLICFIQKSNTSIFRFDMEWSLLIVLIGLWRVHNGAILLGGRAHLDSLLAFELQRSKMMKRETDGEIRNHQINSSCCRSTVDEISCVTSQLILKSIGLQNLIHKIKEEIPLRPPLEISDGDANVEMLNLLKKLGVVGPINGTVNDKYNKLMDLLKEFISTVWNWDKLCVAFPYISSSSYTVNNDTSSAQSQVHFLFYTTMNFLDYLKKDFILFVDVLELLTLSFHWIFEGLLQLIALLQSQSMKSSNEPQMNFNSKESILDHSVKTLDGQLSAFEWSTRFLEVAKFSNFNENHLMDLLAQLCHKLDADNRQRREMEAAQFATYIQKQEKGVDKEDAVEDMTQRFFPQGHFESEDVWNEHCTAMEANGVDNTSSVIEFKVNSSSTDISRVQSTTTTTTRKETGAFKWDFNQHQRFKDCIGTLFQCFETMKLKKNWILENCKIKERQLLMTSLGFLLPMKEEFLSTSFDQNYEALVGSCLRHQRESLKEVSKIHSLQQQFDSVFGNSILLENESDQEISDNDDEEALKIAKKKTEKYRSQKIKFQQLEKVMKSFKNRVAQQSNHAASSFYSDAWPAVCVLIAPTLQRVTVKTKQLLKEFEDHPALLKVIELSTALEALPVFHTTTVTLLNGLELLLDRCEVWEKFAHKGVSLKSESGYLKQHILFLRHQQLSDWEQLRHLREERQAAEAYLWTPDLFMMILEITSLKDDEEKIAKRESQLLWTYLEEQVLSKAIGQFDSRLQVLEILSQLFMSQLDNKKGVQIGCLLGHFIAYANLNSPRIEKSLLRGRKEIDKEIKGLLKVVRWDFNKHQMLKESIRRGYTQLGKKIKKFDSFLEEPVIGYLAAAHQLEDHISSNALEKGILRNVVFKSKIILNSFSNLFSFDQKILRCVSPNGGLIDWSHHLTEVVRAALQTIETSNSSHKKRHILTLKEKLTQELNLIPLARKSDMDFTTSDTGLWNYKEIHPFENLSNHYLLKISSGDPQTIIIIHQLMELIKELWECSHENFYRFMRRAVHLQGSDCHADLLADHSHLYWIGMSHRLFDLCQSNRKDIWVYGKKLNWLIDMITIVCTPSIPITKYILENIMKTLDLQISVLVQLSSFLGSDYEMALFTEQPQQSLAIFPNSPSISHIVKMMDIEKEVEESLKIILSELRELQNLLLQSPEIRLLRSSYNVSRLSLPFIQCIKNCLIRIEAQLHGSSFAEFISKVESLIGIPMSIRENTKESLHQLTTMLNSLMHYEKMSTIKTSHPNIKAALELTMCAITASQNKALFQLSNEDEKIVVDLASSSQSLTESFPIDQILEMILVIFEDFGTLTFYQLHDFKDGLELVFLGLKILFGGLDIVVGTNSVGLIISKITAVLLNNGYCREKDKPEDETPQAGTKDDWQSGTGMGEGDGAKNISDDIEDEDLMDGYKHEEQQQQQRDSKGEENEAVDVSFDVEEDAKNPANKEEDATSENDDREMGDVDLNEGGELEKKRNEHDRDDEVPDEEENEHIKTTGGTVEETSELEAQNNDEKERRESDRAKEKKEEIFDEKGFEEDDEATMTEDGSTEEEKNDFNVDVDKKEMNEDNNNNEIDIEDFGLLEGDKDDVEIVEDQDDNAMVDEMENNLEATLQNNDEAEHPQDEEGMQTQDQDHDDLLNALSENEETNKDSLDKISNDVKGANGLVDDSKANSALDATQENGDENGQHQMDENMANGQQQQMSSQLNFMKMTAGDSPQPQPRRQQPPNPLQDSIEAIEQWLQRISLLSETTKDEEEKDMNEDDIMAKFNEFEKDQNSQLKGLAECEMNTAVSQEAKEEEREEEKKNGGSRHLNEECMDELLCKEPPKEKLKDEQPTTVDVHDDDDPIQDEDREEDTNNLSNKDNAAINSTAEGNQLIGKGEVFNKDDDDANDDVVMLTSNNEINNKAKGELDTMDQAKALWALYESQTTHLATSLCEQLRIILEPTLKGRLHGDYKTGKRLSMKKVVSFIASNFRKDKIWLRRNRPSQRDYQVVVALDNSRSMTECGVGQQALQAICLVCQAFQRLEIGKTGVCSFGGTTPEVVLPLTTNVFGDEEGAKIMKAFTFAEESDISHDQSMPDLFDLALDLFSSVQQNASSSPVQQMLLIISDGRFNKAAVRRHIHAAIDRGIIPTLLITDPAAAAEGDASSTVNMREVVWLAGKPVVSKYLDNFPFPFYAICGKVSSLPATVADIIRQWIEMLSRQ